MGGAGRSPVLQVVPGKMVNSQPQAPQPTLIPHGGSIATPEGGFDEGLSFKPEVDSRGKFLLRLPPGRFRVRVHGERRQELPEVIEVGASAPPELELRLR